MIKKGFLNIFICLSTTFASEVPRIQVLVAKNLDKVTIEGRDITKTLYDSTNKIYAGNQRILFDCHPKDKTASSGQVLLASLESKTGILAWDKHKYRGQLLLSTSENKQSCDLINNISLESYLSSLLAKEMRGDWPIEALKAQAVAARTYALYKMNKQDLTGKFYDLESSEKHQVSGTLFDETILTSKASKETRGLILVGPKKSLGPAFYHSKCGGKTNKPQFVWDNMVPGYKRVECPFCHNHGTKNWKHEMSKTQYLEILLGKGLKLKEKLLFRQVPDYKNNELIRYYIDNKLMIAKKSLLRKKLGRRKLYSNNFVVKIDGEKVHIYGSGRGHGVGLCQFGAFEMAKRGKNYKEILAHYYPGHNLVSLY